MSTNQKTFSIYLANGKKKSGLIKSFLDMATIEAGQHTIETDDGAIWPLYKEPATHDYIYRNGAGLCIISFQLFQDGEFFAVARLYQARIERKKGNEQS